MVTSDSGDSPFDAPSDLSVAEVPSVVAVLVTTDPDERFEVALASLATQDYPSLTVLVVDAGSTDDPSARIGRHLPDAFIRRLPAATTFSTAANEALAAVEGAHYLLFCADDVELADDAVSLLVEEAVRSNAGVVGPKFVDAERPEALLEVGASVDKVGVVSPLVEPGEIDHEQHDAVRDVFALSSATLLVRADLWEEIGGFEGVYTYEVADVDFCWRARLAGARVIVVPDAVVRRPRAAVRERFGTDPDLARADEPTQRLQMLFRNYSSWSLLRVLPQALALTIVQATALTLMGRGRRAWSVITAWTWNLRRLRPTLDARRRIQDLRAVADTDVRSLQIRGFSYVRAFLAGQLDLGGRVDALSGAGRGLAEAVTGSARRPGILFGAVLLVVVLLGSRDLITGGIPSVGTLVPWPGMSEAWREFTSAWRYVGVGSAGPAPTGLAFIAAMTGGLLGAAGMARTLVVVSVIPVAALGAFRLMMPLARSYWSPLGASVAYAVVPLPRNAIAEGRLGVLIFYALAPFALERVLRASGVEPYGRRLDGRPDRDRIRAVLSLALLEAVIIAFFPPAGLLVPLGAAAFLAMSPLAGDRGAAWRGLVVALGATAVAGALLFPWSVGLVVPTPDLDVLGFSFRESLDLGDVLLFDTGPARVGFGWLFVAVALHPLVVGSSVRLRWAARAWALALVGWATAWLPGRLDADVGLPAVEGPLVLSALGIAMAVGLGVGVLREELQRAGLSWRQALSLLAMGALAVTTLPFLGDAFDGRWGLPSRDWNRELSWMRSEASKGGFRVLWVGDPALLPLEPLTTDDGTAFGLTRNGASGVDGLWPLASDGATAHVEHAIEAALAGSTDRLGHLVGPLGIRYVAYPLSAAPGRVGVDEEVPPTPLSRVLTRQVDLSRLAVDPGVVLYENQAWVPAGALASPAQAEELVDSTRGDAVRLDVEVLRPVGGLPRGPDVQVPEDRVDAVEGILLIGEAFDDSWDAVAAGALRPQFRAFGLVNAFPVEDVDRVTVEPGGQTLRYGALGVEIVIWLLVVGVWHRRRVGERAADRAWRAALRDVRPALRPVRAEVRG